MLLGFQNVAWLNKSRSDGGENTACLCLSTWSLTSWNTALARVNFFLTPAITSCKFSTLTHHKLTLIQPNASFFGSMEQWNIIEHSSCWWSLNWSMNHYAHLHKSHALIEIQIFLNVLETQQLELWTLFPHIFWSSIRMKTIPTMNLWITMKWTSL